METLNTLFPGCIFLATLAYLLQKYQVKQYDLDQEYWDKRDVLNREYWPKRDALDQEHGDEGDALDQEYWDKEEALNQEYLFKQDALDREYWSIVLNYIKEHIPDCVGDESELQFPSGSP